MAKGASKSAERNWNVRRTLVKTDESALVAWEAERRVLKIQAKLHQWAREDPQHRFDDLFNLVADPAFLLTAWQRVRGNRGARTPGVDGHSVYYVENVRGVEDFLDTLRSQIKDRSFRPLPVAERLIPKGNGKMRRLGIASLTDRTVQASLKLVLEPIFEADFQPFSYGFRPGRRAHDAIAETRHLTSKTYTWIVEGDITACFDEIDHTALMDRVRRRVGDKRVLALVKAFLKAGIMTADGELRDTDTGTPQGSILSPLLANIALSTLDEHFAHREGGHGETRTERARRRRNGIANYRLVRYADDFVVMCRTKKASEQAEARVKMILQRLGLELHPDKTRRVELFDGKEGFDFLGCHLHKKLSGKLLEEKGQRLYFLQRWPSQRSMQRIRQRVKELTPRSRCHADLRDVIADLNPVLRGWGNYFRTGNAAKRFNQLDTYVWRRLRELRVRRKGRHLRPGEVERWTRESFHDLGLLRLRGTVRYPEKAFFHKEAA